MPNRSQFISFLNQQVCAYRGYLEGMFGKCDERFVFGTIQESTLPCGGPQTPYPGDPGPNGYHDIDIQISKRAWNHYDWLCGAWEVAHEAVHLLDPVPYGSANFLEEGLAAWFQDQPRFHVNSHVDSMEEYVIRAGIGRTLGNDYTIAKVLVCRCMPELIEVVKELRSPTVKISDIDADMLASGLKRTGRTDAIRETFEHLCAKFPS